MSRTKTTPALTGALDLEPRREHAGRTKCTVDPTSSMKSSEHVAPPIAVLSLGHDPLPESLSRIVELLETEAAVLHRSRGHEVQMCIP